MRVVRSLRLPVVGESPILAAVSLGLKNPFLAGREKSERMWAQTYQGRPSIACWRDHSIGASRRRVTPMPRSRRPSIAAFTMSGARKASEIVMLTWRTLQFSRVAMLSTLAFGSSIISLSHRRPRAIEAINVARVSERIGRARCADVPAGNRISLRRDDGILRHATFRVLLRAAPRRSAFGPGARWITS